MQFCITLDFSLLSYIYNFIMLNLNETLGSSKPAPYPAHGPTEAYAVPGRKLATPLGPYSKVRAGVQAPRRRENETARELMFFFFWQETRQKIGSRSCAWRPLPSPPTQALRALQGLLAPARSAFALIPRASCLAPRASSHVPAPARAQRSWQLGGAGLGVAGRSPRR